MSSTKTDRTPRLLKHAAFRWVAISLVVAGLAVLIATTIAPRLTGLVSNPAANTGTICVTCMNVTGPSTTPTLAPGGAASPIPVTFTNLTDGPVYVTQLQISFTNAFSSSCPASNFEIEDSTPGSSVSVSGSTTTVTYSPWDTLSASSSTSSSWTDSGLTLKMLDTSSSQNGCLGLGLSLSYTGTGNYTVLTTTKLTTSSNASTDSESLNATVAPDITPASAGQTPDESDGNVTFYTCTSTTADSCKTPLGTALIGSSGTATLSVPAGAVGSYQVEAVFNPTDPTSFVSSTSPIVTENLTGCVSAQTSNAATIIKPGQTISGNYTVANGTSVWLNGGTITGNVTVAGTGEFAATNGAIGGNVQSSGGPIAIAETSVAGNVQSNGGGISLGPSTVIKGNAQATGGGPFCSQGTSPSTGQVQVRGNLQVQSLTSSTPSSVCSTTVGNNLQWQSNASPGTIGGSCGGNTILGNLLVQSNSGQVSIGASGTGNGNTVSGNTNVNGNTGGGTITNNATAGNCQLSGDKPGIIGTGNSANKANNQCNTSAGGA